MFDLINSNLEFIINSNKNQLRKEKIILTQNSYPKLIELKSSMDSLKSFEIKIEKNTDLINKLLTKYQLISYKNFINNVDYPHLMTLKINPDKISLEQFSRLKEILNSFTSKKIFHSKIIETHLTQINKIESLKPIIYSLEFVFGLISILVVRNIYEQKENKFWQIFFMAGGKTNTRKIKFLFQNSILILITSIVSLFLENYIAKIYHLRFCKLCIPSQIGMLFISGIIVYLKNIKRGI
jgi:hypothetical protein